MNTVDLTDSPPAARPVRRQQKSRVSIIDLADQDPDIGEDEPEVVVTNVVGARSTRRSTQLEPKGRLQEAPKATAARREAGSSEASISLVDSQPRALRGNLGLFEEQFQATTRPSWQPGTGAGLAMPPPRHSAGGAARGPAGGSRGLGRRHQEAAAISPSAAGPSGLSERAPKRRRVLGSSERGSSEEDDFALAARLQREEDERAAREAARRLEEQDHQRLRMRLDALEAAEAAAAARAQAMAAERAVARARNRGAPVDDDDDDITVMPGSTSHRRPRSARAGVPPSPGYAAAAGQRWSTLANLIASGGGRGLMLPQLFGGLAGLGLGMMSEGFGAALPGADGAGGHHRHRHHHGGSGSGSRGRALLDALSNAQRAGIPAHLLLSDRDFTAEDYEMLCRLDQTVENRKGAKQEELDQLPLEVADGSPEKGREGPLTCAICLEDVAPGEVVKSLPCRHKFHSNCIDTWLLTKAVCPVCQQSIK